MQQKTSSQLLPDTVTRINQQEYEVLKKKSEEDPEFFITWEGIRCKIVVLPEEAFEYSFKRHYKGESDRWLNKAKDIFRDKTIVVLSYSEEDIWYLDYALHVDEYERTVYLAKNVQFVDFAWLKKEY